MQPKRARPPPGTPAGETRRAVTIDATTGRDTREALREIEQDADPRDTGTRSRHDRARETFPFRPRISYPVRGELTPRAELTGPRLRPGSVE